MTETQQVNLGLQPGFQSTFASSTADITIGGGAAGCGKSRGAIVCAGRFFGTPNYSAVFFRRTTVQIKNPGGLWDEARKVYPFLGAKPNLQELEWRWPLNAKVKFAHLEHESTCDNWQGAQSPLFVFDELTHFTAYMFWYFLSRNRSECGVRPHILATCNPDADSWVAELIAWWIEQDERHERYGLPIPARAGKKRYFMRLGENFIWGDSRRDVLKDKAAVAAIELARKASGQDWRSACVTMIKSLAFVPGKLEENRILEQANPEYRGNLMAMTRVERERLLNGNWKVRAQAGDYFRRSEVTILDDRPTDVMQWVRRWDFAATTPSETNPDPDWTCGVLMGRRENGRFVIADVILERKRAEDVRQLVKRTAEADGQRVAISLAQDPGQAGKDQAKSYLRMLAGWSVTAEPETGDKETRAEPLAAQWQAGNIEMVRGRWNVPYFAQMEPFPTVGVHDDAVDATSGAFAKLAKGRSIFDVL